MGNRLHAPIVALALLLLASAALADEPGDETVVIPGEEAPATFLGRPELREAPAPSSNGDAFEAAIEHWDDQRPWRYGTQYIFPLTRGMGDAGIPPVARYPLYPFTAIFDLGHLPIGALAGLFGN